LAKASGRFQRAAAGAQRVADLLDTPSLVTEAPGAKPLPRPRGSLDFCAVRFGYTHGQEVLHGISLKIEPDELVAVVGPSGSGKSTLVRLALRLHDPCSGAVRIDGHDLRDVTLDSLRRAVAVVFQEPHLVRGSIAENIGYGQAGHDPPRVAAVAAAAHVNRFADALPAGCDAQVGPRGVWLSGGERQRVALARALLRDCPILLLDEATAAVDSETEALIHDAVDRLAGRRTMLIVGHRLSSIRRADRLVVVEDGRIVESGTPAALLRNSTRCRDLFAAQLGHAEAAI
jgi:ABC-type multidrug transport system fused ATPase/permease subunit